MECYKWIFGLLLMFILSYAYGATYTATWENEEPSKVSYHNTQYRVDTFGPVEDTGDGYRYLGQTSETSKTFSVDVPLNASTLSFRVRACNAAGCSEWAYAQKAVNTSILVTPAKPYNIELIRPETYQFDFDRYQQLR